MSTTTRPITIGTRGSKLALAQTALVIEALQRAHPGLSVSVQRITTRGDVIAEAAPSVIGDKALFVGDIEDALLRGEIDLAVHSTKDMPSMLPEGLVLGAFLPRADPRDALVSRTGLKLEALPPGARVGTSSMRRAAQLRALRPDLEVVEIRGNVDTRLRKLMESGDYDAIVLAVAGLERLGEAVQIAEVLDYERMLPAGGQGAIAVEVRQNDAFALGLIAAIDHRPTYIAVSAERAFQRTIGAGCRAALGVYGAVSGDRLLLRGMIAALDGRMVKGSLEGDVQEAEEIGRRLAEVLLAQGGAELVAGQA